MSVVFTRDSGNPILTAADLPVPAAAVLNPGAVELNGEVVLLVRVEDYSGRSNIHVARSRDGRTDWQVETEPILAYGQPTCRYEQWGCEDARVTYLAEEDLWYITYTAYSAMGAAVGIARTRDLIRAERIGLIFAPNNKDTVLFPKRFDCCWTVLHRPDAGGIEHIWSACSPDLTHWGHPHCVLPEGEGPAWDAVKVGAGPPPIETEFGWLLIYHGVKTYAGRPVYRVGAALLDKEKPHKLIERSRNWIFQAEAPYEQAGLVPNVVFPTGLIRRGDELWMYYGAANSVVCLATARLKDVLASLSD